MKIKLLSTALFITAAVTALAQQPPNQSLGTGRVNTTITRSFGCEGTNCAGLTVDNTAGGVTLTAAQYSPTVTGAPQNTVNAQRADCYNTGAKIWVTSISTVTLASGKGTAILDGGTFTIYGIDDIKNFHAIRDAGVSSTLYCTYSRQP